MGQKKLVRISIGAERALSKPSAFNMLLTAEEREFLGRLCKKIEDNAINEVQYLLVQDISEGPAA